MRARGLLVVCSALIFCLLPCVAESPWCCAIRAEINFGEAGRTAEQAARLNEEFDGNSCHIGYPDVEMLINETHFRCVTGTLVEIGAWRRS